METKHGGQDACYDNHLHEIAHDDSTRFDRLEHAIVLVEEENLLAAKRKARRSKRKRNRRHKHESAFEEV
jgi:hypothetical protein